MKRRTNEKLVRRCPKDGQRATIARLSTEPAVTQAKSPQNAQPPRSQWRCFHIDTAGDPDEQPDRSKPMRTCVIVGVLAGLLAGPMRPASAAELRRADVVVYG